MRKRNPRFQKVKRLERKFAKVKPLDGQTIVFRKYAHKRFYIATYDARTDTVRVGEYTYNKDLFGAWIEPDDLKGLGIRGLP